MNLTEESIEDALRAIGDGRIEDAIHILEPLTLAKQDDPDAYVYLGIAYVQAEKPELAADILRQAQDLCEEHCVLAQFLGRALLSLGQLDEAEEELRKAVRLDPEAQEAWCDLSKVLVEQGNYREAVSIIDQALPRFPADPELRGTRALSLYRLGDYRRASDEWALMHKQHPNLMLATANYAYTLLLMGNNEGALLIIDEAIELDSTDYRSHIIKGLLHFNRENFFESEKSYQEALSSNPRSIESLSKMAILSHKKGDESESTRYLDIAEKQIEEVPECWRGLCFAYSYLGQHEKYMDCLLRWTKRDPRAAAPWIALFREYTKLGLTEKAKRALDKTAILRGYVTIHCSKCDADTELEVDEILGFDSAENQICSECDATISMPAGFSLT
ncbi:MAG: tetratricopeptide repeat protein [Candidatus Thorarchaeota archaeon]